MRTNSRRCQGSDLGQIVRSRGPSLGKSGSKLAFAQWPNIGRYAGAPDGLPSALWSRDASHERCRRRENKPPPVTCGSHRRSASRSFRAIDADRSAEPRIKAGFPGRSQATCGDFPPLRIMIPPPCLSKTMEAGQMDRLSFRERTQMRP